MIEIVSGRSRERARVHLPFPAAWTAEVLAAPPMIRPAAQFTWPERVPGEEDALARGAMLLSLRASGTQSLITCALGYSDPAALVGVWSTPDPHALLAVAGGYAYLADTRAPESPQFLPLRPVLMLAVAREAGVLLLAGSYQVCAIGAEGLRWQSSRLSDEGLQLDEITDTTLSGRGWDMRTDREPPFRLSLLDGSLL